MKTKLTPRQWTTYNFIKNATEMGVWATKDQIVVNYAKCHERADGYVFNNDGHDICSAVWSDINAINLSQEIDKIIITDNKDNFKIAQTEQEAKEYMDKFYNKAIKALVRYSTLKNKIKVDGQGKLLSNRLEPIDTESKAREFVETFMRG